MAILTGALIGALLMCLTFFGVIPIQVGLFGYLVGIPLTGISVLWLIFLVLFRNVGTEVILRGLRYNLIVGSALLVAGIFMLSGIYINRISAGQLEARWILFWPMILAACITFGVGAYRKIVKKIVENLKIWERFLERKDAEPRAFLRRLLEDVILQRPLLQEGRIRWIRHVLIYWGFVLLWLADLTFALLHEYMPFFGVTGFSRNENPIKLALDFSMDLFGLMILLGTSIALIRAYVVRGTESRIYGDTPTATFLFAVVLTGYIVEGVRLASLPSEPYVYYSFLGAAVASLLRGSDLPLDSLHRGFWIFHAVLASSFIAYFPVKRLIHSCALPVGKLMQSQKTLLEKKIKGVVGGLLQGGE